MHGFSIIESAFLVSYGTLRFLFSQAMLLSRRFSNAYVTVENLSIDLEKKNIELNDLNLNLEKRLRSLKAQMTSETANKDMAIAMNVQASIPQETGALKELG